MPEMRSGKGVFRKTRLSSHAHFDRDVAMIAWLIIGGGIHGTYLSHLLVNKVGLKRDDVRVLDPHHKPMAAWNRNATNCGMRFLRSPATHNIDIPVLSLYRFAQSPAVKGMAEFIPPYNRPSLSLFQKHCAHVIQHFRLEELRITGRALALHENNRHSLSAETSVGSITARNVILAMGLGEQPYWPSWARRLKQKGSRIDHVFDPRFRTADIPESTESVVVVGGGLSAVQTALMLSKRLAGTVRLLSQHELYESQYDFDPCWIGPKCLRDFYRQDYGSRRATVDRARVGGSLPGEIFEELRTALEARSLHFKNPAFEARFRMVIAFAWIRMPERCGPIPLSWLPGFSPTGREETLSTRSSKNSDCNAGPAATRLSERIYGGPQTSSSQVPWPNFSSDLVPVTSSAPATQDAICSRC